jgi:hypothetical protein
MKERETSAKENLCESKYSEKNPKTISANLNKTFFFGKQQ